MGRRSSRPLIREDALTRGEPEASHSNLILIGCVAQADDDKIALVTEKHIVRVRAKAVNHRRAFAVVEQHRSPVRRPPWPIASRVEHNGGAGVVHCGVLGPLDVLKLTINATIAR